MSAYPDGCTAASFDAEPIGRDPDDAYDSFMARVDDGEACGICYAEVMQKPFVAAGTALLLCPHCGAESIDTRRKG